jgi:chaperonin GroEL
LQSGFTALQEGKKELSDTPVVVVSRTIRGGTEVVDILQKVSEVTNHAPGQPMRILLVGNLEDDAYNTVIENIKRQTPPMFGEMGKELLEDIAAYCNCEPISETTTLDIIDKKYVGKIHRVKVSKSESTLFADKQTDLADLRIDYIKSQIAAKEAPPAAVMEKLKDRLAKLQGKIALFKIGGATDTSKEEKEFRVEDAINATRAAFTDGVVPGGGATLLRLAGLGALSKITRGALEDTFKQLLLNAGLEAEVKLAAARGSYKGYDLKNGDGELIDMVTAGVLDPKLVVEQVIINATQAAADILTAGGEIIIARKEEK